MPVYLPRNLVGLAGLASRHQGRYALAVVRVRDPGNGLYRAEATDGCALAVIQGPFPEASYPSVEQQCDEGSTELLVPRDAWLQAFKLGDKRRPVGIGSVSGSITLAVGDQSITAPPADVRYPDVDGVIPKNGPLVRVRVSPGRLIELLRLASAIDQEGGVWLLYYGKGKPLGLSAGNDQGQTFDALLMPLAGKEGT